MSYPDINAVLFPHHNKQLRRVEDEKINFSHYTNADTAIKIIKNQEFWLRNISLMNDYSEFEHGKELLIRLVKESDEGKSLKKVFDEIKTGIFDDVLLNFENWAPYIKDDFYISCFSEHKHEGDNDIGKLSMWRAYGGNAGVAIIFKHDLFKTLENFPLDFSSVAYFRENELKLEIDNLKNSLANNINIIKKLDKVELENNLFNIFRFSALCNKHKGFEEEQEWRLIATASNLPNIKYTSQEIMTINGIPQNIVKVKLSDVNFKDVLEKVIIGPSQYPYEVYKSITSVLKSIGVIDPQKIVCHSDIPLRVAL